eukprot:CAMPEP_0194236434 /NCGR_PEP_ID=MMETSP0158-20130606/3674_1 /TAXON_ID=33649 /ORGANISM="Thalassionema nitzschioides, Strain L26-B" /LENGTH=388 /DNA_ID=CAMNT_0038970185 /DNA_START=236 /DNA_END=1399 /DNA_ORIENTATION=-
MCFNAAKSWQLGWYDLREETISVQGTRAYVGTLSSIVDDPSQPGSPILIKMDTSSGDDYYMTFNSRTGFNSGTQEGGDNVLIVAAAGEGLSYARSYLQSKLSAGGVYTKENFDGSGQNLTVTVNSIDASNKIADVSVYIGACPTPTLTPVPPTLAPVSPTFVPTSAPVAPTLAPVDGNTCNGQERCNGGVCEQGPSLTCNSLEVCSLCPNECTSQDSGEAVCGNGVCEDGENCLDCPRDCNRIQNKQQNQRFCCARGPTDSCGDNRCTESGFSCTADPIGDPITLCCGDGICEGSETFATCPNDCTAPVPTPAPVNLPTTSATADCAFCSATGDRCCGTCVDYGKPSGRGCFLPTTENETCPFCSANEDRCCGTCVDYGNPSGRGCFP